MFIDISSAYLTIRRELAQDEALEDDDGLQQLALYHDVERLSSEPPEVCPFPHATDVPLSKPDILVGRAAVAEL